MGKEGDGISIMFCPNCGYDPHANDYLNIDGKNEVHSLNISPVEGTYVCTQCKHSGNLFSIPETDLHKMQFDLDEIDAPVMHAQKASKRFFLYALGFLAIIFVIFQTSSLLLAAALAVILIGVILYSELTSKVR
jgi:hypothetical protein